MKVISLMVFTLSFSSTVLATTFQCDVSNRASKKIGTVIAKLDAFPSTITIEVENEIIYKEIPVVNNFERERGQIIESPAFINKNGAPSSLYARLYRKSNEFQISLSEISYLPIFHNLQGKCVIDK